MSVARVTEIIASSSKSFEDAVKQGIKRANETLDNIEGAWVKDQKVVCDDGKIVEFRVVLKVTFILKKATLGEGKHHGSIWICKGRRSAPV